jgi:hypothetical protein
MQATVDSRGQDGNGRVSSGAEGMMERERVSSGGGEDRMERERVRSGGGEDRSTLLRRMNLASQ